MEPSHLRKVRLLRGLTQQEVAERSGLDRATVRRLELGLTEPHLRTARAIAAVLKVPVKAAFPWSDGLD